MRNETFAGKRALVTGASGFIGSALCRLLSELGAEVHGVSRSERQPTDAVSRWWHCSLQQLDDVVRVIDASKPDLIFHLASNSAGARGLELVVPLFHSNLHSTVNVLTAAKQVGCERVLLTGSLEEPDPSNEWPVPSSPYAAAKFAAATYGRMFHALYELPVVLLRVFMVYGPNQRETYKLIPYVTLSLLKGEAPRLTSGARRVDWIYVDDVARGFAAAASAAGVEGATIDLGTGRLASVREVVETLSELVDPAITPQFGGVADRPMEQIRVADVEGTEQRIGWRAEVELKEGLRRTVEWYREQMPK